MSELYEKLDQKPAENNAPLAAGDATADPFSPERLRLAQNFNATCGVKKELIRIPVDKPDKAWFVRVHPSEEYRLQTGILELKSERGRLSPAQKSFHAYLRQAGAQVEVVRSLEQLEALLKRLGVNSKVSINRSKNNG